MIKEDDAQISLEYLMIFAISLIVLIVFTIPLAEHSIENTMDVSDTLSVKSDLFKLSQAIKQVYGEGQGSKQTVTLNCPNKIKVTVADNYLSANLKLNDNSNKQLKTHFTSNIEKTAITLNKGKNIIVVDWPANSENMEIFKVG